MSAPASAPKLTPSGLAALMCARICHDLVSPISALGTALEVLDDDSNADMHADALELVKVTAGQASAKLQYLRLAFGAAGSAPGIIGLDEIRDLISGMYDGGKTTVQIDTDNTGLEKQRTRLLLNLIMLAVQAIPRGGETRITIRQTGDSEILDLLSTGRKARLDPAVTATLSGKAPDDGFDGRTIQPFYAGMIMREIKASLSTAADEDSVRFTVTIPA